ncbi:MAG TPA: MmgE/PrpD family protein [Casimicrobiaceae bacterium]|nr:MmgE/PrpD family protein [Casimicrobiaceae bacterium]
MSAHAAATLADFVCTLGFDDIPPPVVDRARRHLLDTLGVAIRGRSHSNARSALRGAQALDGAVGRIRVWGSEATLAAPYAALANGVASHALDFDDTHTDSIVHGSAIIAPVVLALGEARDASGRDLLSAFVAGWEVAARIGLASRGTFHARGFHTTSIAGVFGAAAAAARLLALPAGAAAHAIGLAGSQASGINEYLSNSSSAKSLHTGWSAHAGIVAATLAKAGMTGPASVFEGRDGLMRTHGERDQMDVAALTANLGTRWETARISIKPYPCCHFAHAFVDCIGALKERGVRSDDVIAVECVVPVTQIPLICEPAAQKAAPATPYAAKFSLPFLLASRIVDGSIGHATFDARNLTRRDLASFASRVTYRIAKAGETPFPRTFPGWIEAVLRDGRRLVERCDVNAGHPDNPLSAEQVRAKFADNARDTLGENGVARVAQLVAALPSTTASELAAALAPVHETIPQP